MRVDGHPHAGIRSVGDHRGDVGGGEAVLLVEASVRIAVKLPPPCDGLVEGGSLRRAFAAAQVVEGRLVGGHHAAAGAALDAHVAEGHASLHRERTDRVAGEFDEVVGSARGGDLRDDIKDDVFGFHARTQRTVDGDAHRARFGLQDTLAGQHHFDFGGSHAERRGAQRSVRGGVAVAADDGHARLCEALFGADDMDDPLVRIAHAEVLDAVLRAVGGQRLDLPPRLRLFDGEVLADGRDVVVDRCRYSSRMNHADAAPFETGERHGRRHLVDILPVDIEHRAAALFGTHGMRVPDFVQKRSSHLTPPSLCVRLRSVCAVRRETLRPTPASYRCGRRIRVRCVRRTEPAHGRARRRPIRA